MSALPYSAACERNREPILAVLRTNFADRRRVFEIGSGTAQHAVFFAGALPQLNWQTSDLDENLPDIRARLAAEGPANALAPLAFDAMRGPWPDARYDAVFSANTLHIMAWSEVEALFANLPRLAGADCKLVIYGPFNYAGAFTSASNASFDAELKQRAPHMGIRDVEAVQRLAQNVGFKPLEDIAMPANNRCLVWQRSGS